MDLDFFGAFIFFIFIMFFCMPRWPSLQLSIFMLIGIFTTLLIPETKRKTLEELSEELHGEVDPSKLANTNYGSDNSEKAA